MNRITKARQENAKDWQDNHDARMKSVKELRRRLAESHRLKETDISATVLNTIKTQKLFREDGFRSFSAWCEKHSPFSVKYSYRLSSRKPTVFKKPFFKPESTPAGKDPDPEPFVPSEDPTTAAAEQAAMDSEGAAAVKELTEHVPMPVHGTIVDEETGKTLNYFDDPPLNLKPVTTAEVKALAEQLDDTEVRPEDRHPDIVTAKAEEILQRATDDPFVAAQAVVDLSEATQKVLDGTEESLSHAGIDEAIRGAGEDGATDGHGADHPTPAPAPQAPVKDAMGNVIPDHMAEGYTSAHVLFEKTYDHIYSLRDTLKKLLKQGSAVQLASQRVENIFASLASVEKTIDKCRPFTVCLYCSGSNRQCNACNNSRFLTEQQYLDSARKERS